MTDAWKEIPRLAITGVILALFTYAVITHWGTGLEETLKNIVLLAVGFWLGSSRGAQTQNEAVNKALDLAAAPTAPQPVVVTNSAAEPVPTEEAK
jgi:hypothetical protein